MEMSERRKLILSLSNEESRRVTREAVQGALFRLMGESSLKNIKIVDLVKVAGISRSAFYRNYNSIEEVLLDAVDVPIRQVIQAIGGHSADNWRLIIDTVRSNERMLTALWEAGLFHVLLDRMNACYPPDNYMMMMWNGLIFNVIQLWVQNGMKERDEAILGTIDAAASRLARIIYAGRADSSAPLSDSEITGKGQTTEASPPRPFPEEP